jgi:hypothetical protein
MAAAQSAAPIASPAPEILKTEIPEPKERMIPGQQSRPNHAMEPTPVAVTVLACARTAPSTYVAHLLR